MMKAATIDITLKLIMAISLSVATVFCVLFVWDVIGDKMFQRVTATSIAMVWLALIGMMFNGDISR